MQIAQTRNVNIAMQTQKNKAIDLSQELRELRRCIIAAALTLVLGVTVYFYIPVIQAKLQEKESAAYQRAYSYTDAGVIIAYKPLRASEKTAARNNDANSVSALQMDLAILARRFQRGDFAMISLPGIKNTAAYRNIIRYRNAYQYNLQKQDAATKTATLQIKASSAAAKQALQNYARYLEKNWRL